MTNTFMTILNHVSFYTLSWIPYVVPTEIFFRNNLKFCHVILDMHVGRWGL